MNADCAVCGSLWRRDVLSLPRPECPSCEKGICTRCEQIRCVACGTRVHEACSHTYRDEQYCSTCADQEVTRDLVEINASLLEALTLREKLVASIAIVMDRKGQAA